jgi:ABC-type polysaccharide/polyol phosphate transport system ATPase subunit
MAIRLQGVGKSFIEFGRSRRPLYREVLTWRSAHRQGGAKLVLRDIDLDVRDGSRVAVVGRNGAGKSTLLRLIAGIYRPTAGQIHVDGRACCFLEPGAGAAPSLSVRDNVFLYASLAGLSHTETRKSLAGILEFCSLTEQEYTWVEHLSYGMQQRLFVSILLEAMRIRRAEVFLFDEFLIGVDKAFRQRVETALTTFPSSGQIVMHASHDHDMILRTCPLAILVDGHGIRRFGPTEEVLAAYRGD